MEPPVLLDKTGEMAPSSEFRLISNENNTLLNATRKPNNDRQIANKRVLHFDEKRKQKAAAKQEHTNSIRESLKMNVNPEVVIVYG